MFQGVSVGLDADLRDTIDTATCYNNLACCFCGLQRPIEALAFMELAVEILKALAGEDHPRTVTAIRNLAKAMASLVLRLAPWCRCAWRPRAWRPRCHTSTACRCTTSPGRSEGSEPLSVGSCGARGKKKKKGRSKSGSPGP